MDKDKISLIQNKEIEQMVLSSIFIDEILFNSIEPYGINIFYYTQHQQIYKAMIDIKKQDLPIDITTVCKFILEKFKGVSISYVAEVASTAISTVYFEKHLGMLADYENKRNILEVLSHIDYSNSTEIISDKISQLLDSVLNNQNEDKNTREALFEYIDDIYTPKLNTGIKIGLNTIDSKTGGFLPGHLITIAGYTGTGKSILVTQLILNMIKQDKKISLFSLEMSRTEIFNKITSNACSIEFNKFILGTLSDLEKDKLTSYISSFLSTKEFEIYEFIDDINKIISQIKKDKMKKKVDVVFIDLINRVSDSNYNDSNRALFLSSITRKLKLLAGKLKISIVITAQINRTVEGRQDKVPTLADIKESGGMAEDSDLVLGLYRNKSLEDEDMRKELFDKGKLNYQAKDANVNPNCLEVHILKGRNIELFKAGFYWDPKFQRIGNMG